MSLQITLTLLVLLATIVLFVTEIVRVDVVAIIVMVTLPWLGLLKPIDTFSGFASNAVIAMIGVMIMGHGIDRSGVMDRITRPILSVAGSSEKRLIGLISLTVGAISSFMQNIGAAALFLPSLMRISKRANIPASRLLMPMGFAAILGGTLTLFASSPLILLNDLLIQEGLSTFGIFAVTPIGLTLLGVGVLYFLVFGRSVLPGGEEEMKRGPEHELIETWELPKMAYQCKIPEGSPLVGETPESVGVRKKYNLHLLTLTMGRDTVHAPWRHTQFSDGHKLVLTGEKDDLERFVDENDLILQEHAKQIKDLRSEEEAGFAEVIIPPRSSVIGKTLRELEFRKKYRVEPLILLKGDEEKRKDFSDQTLEPGDSLVVYGRWSTIKKIEDERDFVLITPVESKAETGEGKPLIAMTCFIASVALAVMGVRLSLSFMSGALAMIVLGVLPIQEAYESIDWKTIFLISGLIPLGLAMEQTGTAAYLANNMLQVFQGVHPLLLMTALAGLTTLFTLFMSNVAAAVLLVPLSITIGEATALSPVALALLVGVTASNSFLFPTHQVNALIMSPGGYRNKDYMKAGGILSVIFIVITVVLIYFFYM